MSGPPEVVVHRDGATLAAAVAARLVTALVDAQAARGGAHVVLTGGGVGIAVLAALAEAPARDAVDWSRLDVWFGDERFLPDGDPERNETQARAALLDRVPLPPGRVHAMGAAGAGAGPEEAAEAYAAALAAARRVGDPPGVPGFDVVLLGMGPDGHVASLFPEHPATREEARSVVAVHGSPKPPPTRLTLTFPALRAGAEVWLVVSGEGKAPAVRLALSEGAGPVQVPAAGVRGRRRTLLLLDEAAAGLLPRDLARPASP